GTATATRGTRPSTTSATSRNSDATPCRAACAGIDHRPRRWNHGVDSVLRAAVAAATPPEVTMDLRRFVLILALILTAGPAFAADGGPEWLWRLLESEAGMTAVVVILSGVLAIFWPPAGAFVLRL